MNDIKLQESHPIDENLRPLKVGGEISALEIASHSNGARITGDLELTGKISQLTTDFIISGNALVTINSNSGGDILLDSSKAVILDAANTNSGAGIQFLKAGTRIGVFEAHHGYSALFLYENEGASTDDAFAIQCSEHGATTIVTVDSAAANAHLTIKADGHVEFDGCGVGFDLVTPTYNATDTDVDFTTGNKQFVTFGSGNIADLNLKFPIVSGNFVLLLKQDGTGSRTVDADGWLAFDSAGNAANGSSTVKFAGGSNPTLTTDANHVDIISFFWDADNEIAYGVASLDFQF